MQKNYILLTILFLFLSGGMWSQDKDLAPPTLISSSASLHSAPLSQSELLPPQGEFKIVNPRNRGSNKIVPGKGYPKGIDGALQKEMGTIKGKVPELIFDAATSGSTPTDPTGAAGPNHYVNAWNSSFAIYDKQGNILSPPASLSSLGGTFTDEDKGDPIVVYDEFADRFLITQYSENFAGGPGGFLVAVSKGPDPVNDGWYTYRFDTTKLPDYPKFYVWSDGYYITTNKDQRSPSTSEVVYVLERDKMLLGEEAQFVGFPLPGINVNAFYSPSGFSVVGDEMPPKGNAPIIYFQDDAWMGVNDDHLKIWLINVDWENTANSTIEESQELGGGEGVSPFISTFDGGSFVNLPQPGETFDVDALQGAIMYMTPYRRFATHNSVVFNFVVDVDGSAAEHAGIRWYELRQDADGDPWRVHQEGTYAPDYSDRWCASMGIDKFGNIGMGFTVLNNSPVNPIYPSLRYTGRFADDPPGQMTIKEVSIVEGESPNPSFRYGDYAHLTTDPVDGVTFWYIGEYFVGEQRKNRVGVFRLAPAFQKDVGVSQIIAPISSSLGSEEEVTVMIRNFGSVPQSNVPVEFTVEGGQTITAVYEGTIPVSSEVEFTFPVNIDLSEVGQVYQVSATTGLTGDEMTDNDALSAEVENLQPVDVGVISVDAPTTGLTLGSDEALTVTLHNFGGEPQSNIPVSFLINGTVSGTEIYEGTLDVGEEAIFTFETPVDLSDTGTYEIVVSTDLEGDAIPTNDSSTEFIASLNCIPEGSECGLGDRITDFYLEDIINENIPCLFGYNDYIGYYTELDRTKGEYVMSLKAGTASGNTEQVSMWIDLNDNGSFDPDEIMVDRGIVATAGELQSYPFSLPAGAPLGQHLLRVRIGDVRFAGDLNNPCVDMDYGSTHDYSVIITDGSLDPVDLDITEAEMIVSSDGDDIFDIRMQTSYEETLRITVHNMLGQKLVENKVEKSGRIYYYELDMSYAASGVYLVRLGTRDVGKVTRIIVK